MEYIIFDLEFTVIRKKMWQSEIIEIGAVKVREDADGSLHLAESFQTFVKPLQNQSMITPYTTEFTGIRQEDVDGAPKLGEAIGLFRDWIGTGPSYLCSWGPDDKHQLVRHCRENGIPLKWIRNYNDLQQQFSAKINTETYRQIGLKNALELLEIEFTGNQHRAIDDAANTAKIFINKREFFVLQENNAEDDLLYTTRTIYKTGDDAIYPFGDLAKLLDPTIS
jgi:inhibitor of KinA sporulation pathway (predicted exonuclease)